MIVRNMFPLVLESKGMPGIAGSLRNLPKLQGSSSVLLACDTLEGIPNCPEYQSLPNYIVSDTALWISAAILAAYTGQVREFRDGVLKANASLRQGLRNLVIN